MKQIIENVLATIGLGDMGWDYIDDIYVGPDFIFHLPNGPQSIAEQKEEKWKVLDCRDMEDGPGNPLVAYDLLISRGCQMIEDYGKVMVGCTAGISRSNAIAAGILMKKFGYSYYEALGLVHEKVETDLIERAHLNALKKLEKNWKNV
jgi:protein-tyrosine phosphatase